MPVPHFIKQEIGTLDNTGRADMNTLFTVGDVNGDGLLDIVSAGRSGLMAWFENPGAQGTWIRHDVNEVENKECGGLVYSLAGAAGGDIINGGDWRSDELCWWENPGASGGSWQKRVIARAAGTQFHDELIGDITGDGTLSLIFWNQGSQTLFCAPLPANPRVSPWPEVEVIAAGMNEGGQAEEGLALADLDGDGQNEIVAGTHWYKFTGSADRWERHKFASGYISTVITIADIDADGSPEVVLSEGDACIYGKPEGGKCAWFKPGADIRQPWTEHLIADALLDPHSLQAGDICGNGRADLLVGEIGVRERYEENPPRLMVFENDGAGRFTRHIIDEGTGTHHARLVDLRNCGVLDIASRPLHGSEKWKIFVWYNLSGGVRTPPPP